MQRASVPAGSPSSYTSDATGSRTEAQKFEAVALGVAPVSLRIGLRAKFPANRENNKHFALATLARNAKSAVPPPLRSSVAPQRSRKEQGTSHPWSRELDAGNREFHRRDSYLYSTARCAEEDSISVEMASRLQGRALRRSGASIMRPGGPTWAEGLQTQGSARQAYDHQDMGPRGDLLRQSRVEAALMTSSSTSSIPAASDGGPFRLPLH